MIHVNNEYGKINKIVVGNIVESDLTKDVDLSFSLFYCRAGLTTDKLKYSEKYIEERTEDLNNLQKIMESKGIHVVRPLPLKKSVVFNTPYWKSIAHSCECPRDQFLILGDTIIETAPVIRNRYFENDTMKEIFYEEFKDGAKWVLMPKPIMFDSSFDKDLEFNLDKEIFLYKNKASKNDVLDFNRLEIMLDGAMCLKFGKDIIVNVYNRNVQLGFLWLQRIFPEYNWHSFFLKDSDHIDGELTILKPGLLITKHDRENFQSLKFLDDWEFLPFLDREAEEADNLTSDTIGLNFVVSGNDIFIQDTAINTMSQLDKLGFNIIPVQLRHSRIFGGGVHCATLELNRED